MISRRNNWDNTLNLVIATERFIRGLPRIWQETLMNLMNNNVGALEIDCDFVTLM